MQNVKYYLTYISKIQPTLYNSRGNCLTFTEEDILTPQSTIFDILCLQERSTIHTS